MFIDETVISVKAGDGGNGCFAYAREKYKPKGKPSGGNGGRGGHVFIAGSVHVHTLLDISYHHSYKAERGEHGKGSNKYGRSGNDVIIQVPLGTVIMNDDNGEILLDCMEPDKKVIIARGGRGGRGNASLVSPKNPNPDHAEYGKKGESKNLRLNLKVLADVGLVGRPNAGKSTFLSIISQARPKIADYPFTTKEPHLGIVKLSDEFDSFVVADIPGLIEDSHKGKGLGIRFLKHIERTRILAILIEAISDDPETEAEILINELRQYSPILAEKPKCFILSKTDLLPKESIKNIPGWLLLSSVTKAGVGEIIREFKNLLAKIGEQ